MIKLNGVEIEQGRFPDKTLLMRFDPELLDENMQHIFWRYESDSEMFALYSLVHAIREYGVSAEIALTMPYIPNARMDRVQEAGDVFTLKYFAKFINDLKFSRVTVVDAHSNVSLALLDRVNESYPESVINIVLNREMVQTLFFPDEGALKRYASNFQGAPITYGRKDRDWATGKILSLEIVGKPEDIEGKNVLIVDDICSKGGTFYHSAKALRDMGAARIVLFVTHCEDSILYGDMIKSGLIDKIYTTDSLISKEAELAVNDLYGNLEVVRMMTQADLERDARENV
jgi:ribose-phosphate pyrophosphokinase